MEYSEKCLQAKKKKDLPMVEFMTITESNKKRGTKFYWESLGQRLEYDSRKKYLVYFCGCFSPPHRGHFSVVEEILQHPNTKVFIHQIGDEARHGVPFRLSQRIWNTYVHRLLPQERIALKPQISLSQLYEHIFLQEADTLVIVRGNEQSTNNMNSIQRTENRASEWFRDCIKRLQRRGKEVVFIYPDRPLLTVLSATKFTEALITCKRYRWNEKYRRLRHFLPKNLSEGVARRIIESLEKCNLH